MIRNLIFGTAVAAVLGFASAPSEAAFTFNGISLNGVNLNGISLNGVNLNGISLNGILESGVSSAHDRLPEEAVIGSSNVVGIELPD